MDWGQMGIGEMDEGREGGGRGRKRREGIKEGERGLGGGREREEGGRWKGGREDKSRQDLQLQLVKAVWTRLVDFS